MNVNRKTARRKTARDGNNAQALADTLDCARACARDIDPALADKLARTRDLVRHLVTFSSLGPDALDETRDFARILASDIAHIRDLDLAHARELALAGGRNRIKSIDDSFGFADHFLYALGSRHGGPSRRTPGLVGDRVRAYNALQGRMSAFDALARDLDIAYTNASALAAVADAREYVPRVHSNGARDDESGKHRLAGRVTRPARRLVTTAAGLLPREDQARYREEWQGELDGLAEAGAGRRWQVRHSLRLVARTPLLRIELRAARGRRAIL